MDASARTGDLDAVRQRRAELRGSFDALERALAAPASGRAVIWGEQVRQAVWRMAGDFAEHVEITEGPGGLHQAILSGDIRLANQVSALTAEHAQIAGELAELAASTEPPVTPDDVAEVRDRGTTLLGRVSRHRQRGADLIYEAFETDIGGGD